MTTANISAKKNIIVGILLGTIYGLILRISFESNAGGFLQIISVAFLVGAPLGVGAIAVYVSSKNRLLTFGEQTRVACMAMSFFLISMYALFLEGLICLVLVVPVFFVASILGAWLAGVIIKYLRKPQSGMLCLGLLPFLLGPVETLLPPAMDSRLVSTSIIVNAPADKVFDQLATAHNIQSNELGFSFLHLIGLPRPLEAKMDGDGLGAVRTSVWEKGVRFQEEITEWNKPHRMHYKFHIPANSIPRDALDRHVELGGEYFTVLTGGYDLQALPDGKTKLTLSTTFINKSHLQLYGNIWGSIVLNDFHKSILGLMKNRAEANNYLTSL